MPFETKKFFRSPFFLQIFEATFIISRGFGLHLFNTQEYTSLSSLFFVANLSVLLSAFYLSANLDYHSQ